MKSISFVIKKSKRWCFCFCLHLEPSAVRNALIADFNYFFPAPGTWCAGVCGNVIWKMKFFIETVSATAFEHGIITFTITFLIYVAILFLASFLYFNFHTWGFLFLINFYYISFVFSASCDVCMIREEWRNFKNKHPRGADRCQQRRISSRDISALQSCGSLRLWDLRSADGKVTQ